VKGNRGQEGARYQRRQSIYDVILSKEDISQKMMMIRAFIRTLRKTLDIFINSLY
jgi:hypothetical protein